MFLEKKKKSETFSLKFFSRTARINVPDKITESKIENMKH